VPEDAIGSSLTVYFDGQFWLGHCERWDRDEVWIARHVFGPEPSLPEIAAFVAGGAWDRLRFLPKSVDGGSVPVLSGNPKRRQREAARLTRIAAPSTRSQSAMQAALDEQKVARKVQGKHERIAAADQKRQQLVEKRKQKKRGH
jgi:hypothetical protein